MSLRQGAYVLLLLTVVLAIAGEWAPDGIAAGAWCLPLALLLLGLAFERFETARLQPRLVVEGAQRWLLGRPQSLTLRLTQAVQRTRLYELAPEAPADVEWDRSVRQLLSGPQAPAQVALIGVARRLGAHVWPAQRVRVAGALGLAWWGTKLQPTEPFHVVPDALAFRERAAGLTLAGSRATVQSGAGSQVDQLRDHRPGDPLRIVDWKATARRRSLTSRDFSDEQHVDVILALDVGRSSGIWCGDLDRLGHYVNVAARFAEHALAREDRVGLVVYAERPLLALPPARGLAGITQIRKALGDLAPRPVDSNPLPAAARIRALARQRSLVVLLTDIDDANSSSQLVGAVRLLQPKHLPLVVGLASAALGGYSRLAARDWLDPYLALAAQLGAEQRDRSIRALAALGTTALVTRPELLEREVFATYGRFRSRRRV